MEEAIKNAVKSINFTKIQYMLLSNGKGDCPQAELLVKELGDCKITHMPFFSGDDPMTDDLGELIFVYPTLHVMASWNTEQYIGYEAIKRYVNKKLAKKYLLTWLALDRRISMVVVSKIVGVSFF